MASVGLNEKRAILGCQIAGEHAGEIIHEWVAAIAGGVRLSTLAGAIHVYPTLAEISKRAAIRRHLGLPADEGGGNRGSWAGCCGDSHGRASEIHVCTAAISAVILP